MSSLDSLSLLEKLPSVTTPEAISLTIPLEIDNHTIVSLMSGVRSQATDIFVNIPHTPESTMLPHGFIFKFEDQERNVLLLPCVISFTSANGRNSMLSGPSKTMTVYKFSPNGYFMLFENALVVEETRKSITLVNSKGLLSTLSKKNPDFMFEEGINTRKGIMISEKAFRSDLHIQFQGITPLTDCILSVKYELPNALVASHEYIMVIKYNESSNTFVGSCSMLHKIFNRSPVDFLNVRTVKIVSSTTPVRLSPESREVMSVRSASSASQSSSSHEETVEVEETLTPIIPVLEYSAPSVFDIRAHSFAAFSTTSSPILLDPVVVVIAFQPLKNAVAALHDYSVKFYFERKQALSDMLYKGVITTSLSADKISFASGVVEYDPLHDAFGRVSTHIEKHLYSVNKHIYLTTMETSESSGVVNTTYSLSSSLNADMYLSIPEMSSEGRDFTTMTAKYENEEGEDLFNRDVPFDMEYTLRKRFIKITRQDPSIPPKKIIIETVLNRSVN